MKGEIICNVPATHLLLRTWVKGLYTHIDSAVILMVSSSTGK